MPPSVCSGVIIGTFFFTADALERLAIVFLCGKPPQACGVYVVQEPYFGMEHIRTLRGRPQAELDKARLSKSVIPDTNALANCFEALVTKKKVI